MGKVIKEYELNKVINEEKVKIYEMENHELQIILNNYWNGREEERPKFPNIRDEIFYLLNKPNDADITKKKRFLFNLRGKNHE